MIHSHKFRFLTLAIVLLCNLTIMNLFVYGTLMVEAIWLSIVQGKYHGERGILQNYSRRKLRGQIYPVMIFDPGSKIEGIIYFGIHPMDLARLDDFEGDGYKRIQVMVDGRLQDPVPCQAYLDNHSDPRVILEDTWDFEYFLQHDYKKFLIAFPGWKSLGE